MCEIRKLGGAATATAMDFNDMAGKIKRGLRRERGKLRQ
jgi:hypothetical protein